MGGSFCVGNGEGIEALAKPIFIRGVSPFNGSGTAAPFNGRHASRPLHPKSLRQIGGAGVFGTNSRSVYEPLMGGSFCVGNGEGIEVLAKPIFIRGVSPFNGSGTAAPFNGRHASRPLHPKSLRQIGGAGVFGTNSRSVYEPLMGGSFCVGNGEGIEVLAKPIFIRGVSPFNGSGTAAPVPAFRTRWCLYWLFVAARRLGLGRTPVY